MDSIVKLEKSLDGLGQLDFCELENELSNCRGLIEDIFIGATDSVRFATILKLKFINPINDVLIGFQIKIKQSQGRSGRVEKANFIKKKDLVTAFKNDVYISYNEQLQDNLDFVSNKLSLKDELYSVLNPTNDLPVFLYSKSKYCFILKQSCYNILKYFEENLKLNKDYKDELFFFIRKSQTKIKLIDNELGVLIKHLEYLDSISNNTGYFSDSHEIELLSEQKAHLLKINKQLEDNFYFLKIADISNKKKEFVFKDVTLDVLRQFCIEVSDFFDASVSIEDLVDVFTLNTVSSKKIKFSNETLNDYASLINSLQPLFVDDISNSKTYNQWWCDNFLYNGVDKNKKAISTMRSNTRKDITRSSHKRNKIKTIINVLA